MTTNKIEITNYTSSDRSELLRLLLELHSTHFLQTTTVQYQELHLEKDVKRSFENYLDHIENIKDGTWKILMAKTQSGQIAGFIIGSISIDEESVLSKIGKLEDWFVEQQFRGQKTGIRLYNELEKWFIESGCKQVHSDTWQGNHLSIKAHEELGFFVTGIKFRKKIIITETALNR